MKSERSAIAAPRGGCGSASRLDRASFGVTKEKGMVGRTVDVTIEAVAQLA